MGYTFEKFSEKLYLKYSIFNFLYCLNYFTALQLHRAKFSFEQFVLEPI